METKKAIKRTIEIEEFTNRYLIHPISGWLVPVLHRRDIHPNSVSLAGALSGIVAAICYYNYPVTAATVAGFVFMACWHVLDGADGQLARLSGKVTAAGYVIDGICDYTTFIFVYVALALRMSEYLGPGVWTIVVLAGASHMVQAAAFEMQRAAYNRWVSGKALADAPSREPRAAKTGGPLGLLARVYAAVQRPFRPINAALDGRLRAFGTVNPAQAEQISQAYRERFRRGVLHWSWLSANNRTIAIFIGCLIGHPMLYFAFELIALNIGLVLLVRMNRRRAEQLSGWLAINGG
jgi:phosphatidylglycerophosphate synthase